MRNFFVISILVVFQVLGDIFLSQGMRHIGELTTFTAPAIFAWIIQIFFSPTVWVAVICLLTSMLAYMSALARLDLSYVLPITASNYVLNALFAWLFLGEQVSPLRWVATAIVSIGILLVGLSEETPQKPEKSQKTLPKKEKEKVSNFYWFSLPLTLYASKTWLAIFAVAFGDSAGDIFLSVGMKQIGDLKSAKIRDIILFVSKIFTNYLIMTGILCMTISFVMFLSVLSWADISFVRPASSIGYLVSLLGARLILNERITQNRLFGTTLICTGVAFLSMT